MAPRIRYSEAAHWGDSSNKLSWLIPDLAALFPKARFVHLVRDGRKVASSYFHKLGERMLRRPLHRDPAGPLRRSPACIPRRRRKRNTGGRCPAAAAPTPPGFRAFRQFERICWHWAEINRVVLEELSRLAAGTQRCSCAWKNCAQSPSAVRGLYEFLNLPYRDEAFARFRPAPQRKPAGRPAAGSATSARNSRPSPATMLARLGYAGRPEYVVNY